MKSPISSAITSIQKQYLGSHESDMREASSLVAAETCRCEIEATQRPVMKIPKHEPLHLSQDQYIGSQAEGIDSGYFYINIGFLEFQLKVVLHSSYSGRIIYHTRTLGLKKTNMQKVVSRQSLKVF